MIKKSLAFISAFLFIFIALAQSAQAADWLRLNLKNSSKFVFLDHDSIYRSGSDLYYVVRFKNSEGIEKAVYVKSNAEAGKIGIIKTKDFKDSEYKTPKSWAGVKVFMKKVDESSFICQIDKFAQDETALQKVIAERQLRKESLNNAKQELYKKYDGKFPGMKDYIISVEKQIKQNWKPPVMKEYKSAKVQFKISKDGNLMSAVIKESSNDKNFDNLALETVKKTAPFEKFPQNTDKNEISVIMKFEYFVMEVNKQKE